MMASLPADRFASYDELLAAIDAASIEHTRPAGFWVRCIASGIDLAVVGAILTAVAALIYLVTRKDPSMDGWVLPVGLGYGTIAIGRWGTTGGKALFELELVTHATGLRPSWRRAALRELALVGPPVVGSLLWRTLGVAGAPGWLQTGLRWLEAVYWIAAACALWHAAMRVPGKRAPWDRIAGTIVRYRRR
jgi:hypothetical protein